ncbi:hypothetical protein PIB30_052046 [Stylosanthes scabra]|uniref:Uncharacterized protein n=1 Tax=Stylosanthes scabra TaxID=79078 RepID=A0ABU6TIM2_9FABA|nr:hypothetical protein [Stylosanthes scabra]
MDVSHQIKLTSHLQKLPEEVFINRHHDATTFGASLTIRETRDVGNTGLPEFGATVPDIGPRRPKSIIDVPRSTPFGFGTTGVTDGAKTEGLEVYVKGGCTSRTSPNKDLGALLTHAMG